VVTIPLALGNRRTVRVWFGQTVIAHYTAEPALAERYENAMRRRFAGLATTNEPVGSPVVPPAPGEGGR
jgi:hypothetical protein